MTLEDNVAGGCDDGLLDQVIVSVPKRVDADAAALLDERFFLYAEDVDLCARIRLLNRQILFAPNIEVVHYGGRSGLNNKPNTHRAYRQSQLAFYRKYHPGWERLLRLYLRMKRDLPRGV